MGSVDSIDVDSFPKQTNWVGQQVKVCFHYGPADSLGIVRRMDAEAPGETIIELDDGRYILGGECQFGLTRRAAERPPTNTPEYKEWVAKPENLDLVLNELRAKGVIPTISVEDLMAMTRER